MIDKEELRNAVALRLRQVRSALGFGRERMSNELEIQRGSYARKERGGMMLTPEQLHYLSTRHGINLDWLLTGNGSMLLAGAGEGAGEQEKQEDKHPVPGAAECDTGTPAMLEDYRRLFSEMERIPLLRFEVLAFFHRFKKDNSDLF